MKTSLPFAPLTLVGLTVAADAEKDPWRRYDLAVAYTDRLLAVVTGGTSCQPFTGVGCLDCGAVAGDECDSSCASWIATQLDAIDDAEPACCPTPGDAARSLCRCWGSPGQWIGSAA